MRFLVFYVSPMQVLNDTMPVVLFAPILVKLMVLYNSKLCTVEEQTPTILLKKLKVRSTGLIEL